MTEQQRADRDQDVVRISRERLHQLAGAEQTLRDVLPHMHALRAQVRVLQEAFQAAADELELLRPIELRARFAAVNPLSTDAERATGRAILGEFP